MLVEKSVALQPYNTFGIAARAQRLLRVRKADLLPDLIGQPGWRADQVCVLGGGSNIVLTGDVERLVLKVEMLGRRVLRETEAGYLVEAEAGENWHDFVTWTLDRGWPGLENLALIPGSVGAAPVQPKAHACDQRPPGQPIALRTGALVFEDRIAVAKAALRRIEAEHLPAVQIDRIERMKAVLQLQPVGANVLHRGCAHAAGNQR